MTDRTELRRRARYRIPVVRSDEPPTSLIAYKQRRELAAYEERRRKIREAREAIERQKRQRDEGSPRFFIAYLLLAIALLAAVLTRGCGPESEPPTEISQ